MKFRARLLAGVAASRSVEFRQGRGAFPRLGLLGRKRERFFQGPYGSSLREPPSSALYLYLSELAWAKPWIEGGAVPVFPAKKYLAEERQGTSTPDEIRQERWDGAGKDDLANAIVIGPGCKDIRIISSSVNGRILPDTRIDNYFEHASILCFSSVMSDNLMQQLEKKCCLEIVDLERLINEFSNAFGNAFFGYVKYTDGKERSHFMKSDLDSWMSEYRLVCPGDRDVVSLNLPQGIARLLTPEEMAA